MPRAAIYSARPAGFAAASPNSLSDHLRRGKLDLHRPGGHHLSPVALGDRIPTEQIAEKNRRPLRLSGRDHHACDRAGTVGVRLPFGPPHEVGSLVLAEIDTPHRDLVRIEAGGTKPRVASWHRRG